MSSQGAAVDEDSFISLTIKQPKILKLWLVGINKIKINENLFQKHKIRMHYKLYENLN